MPAFHMKINHVWMTVNNMVKLFNIGRIILGVGIAKSGLWQTKNKKEVRVYYLSLQMVKREGLNAVEGFIGPFSIIIGRN